MYKKTMKHSRLVATLGVLALLTACSTDVLNPAHVLDRSTYSQGAKGVTTSVSDTTQVKGAVRDSGRKHIIAQGDTIYNISYRYGIDQHQLMTLNGITDPTQLKLGESLRLPVAVRSPGNVSVNPEVRVVKATPMALSRTGSSAAPTPAPSAPGAVVEDKPVAAPAAPKAEDLPAAKPLPPLEPVPSGTRLLWPVKGKVITKYPNDVKGINIGGKIGDVVVAALDGDVLFVGPGVKGYGNLVIIRHSPQIVTAYGHLSKITVNRNQRVRAGQKIGELGDSDAKEPMLRFEVREKGQPVDPLKFLPKR